MFVSLLRAARIEFGFTTLRAYIKIVVNPFSNITTDVIEPFTVGLKAADNCGYWILIIIVGQCEGDKRAGALIGIVIGDL